MNVMDADIGGEPAQGRGQVVEGTAFQRLPAKIPLFLAVPFGFAELVLHVEQPHADRAGEQDRREMDDDEGDGTHDQRRGNGDAGDGGVGAHHAYPPVLEVADQFQRQAVFQDENKRGPEPEQHGRVPVDAIQKLPPRGQAPVFLDRQRGDVPRAAPVQVARTRMMAVMQAAPIRIRSPAEHPDDAAHPIVPLAAAEEGTVAAVVLDHEEANKKNARRYG